MKSPDSLSKSANANLKRILKESQRLIANVKGILNSKEPPEDLLPSMRLQGFEINKSIHEFSAYHNARTTE